MKRWLLAIMCCVVFLSVGAKGKKQTRKEPLFGKALASYTVSSNALNGAVFYLVSGHGGPDPGCIGKYQGKELHEDEYAYDIILRLGRELLTRGATVHFIIQDKKDGIRNTQQRCDAINRLHRKSKSTYKRAIFIHVDSRSKGKQTDVFFYHSPGSKYGKRLAEGLHSTFSAKYDRHQPNRGFSGTVSERNLYVLRNTTPYAVFLELGNIQNPQDQKRLVIPDNRQALANWITEAIVKDFKKSK